MTMTLLALPHDMVLHVAECLATNRDISALARCNRHLYSLLNGFLYRHGRNGLAIAAPWAAAGPKRIDTLRRIQEFGLCLADSPGDILHKAAGLGHINAVRYMLDSGDGGQFDVESRDADGRTPLFAAAEEGHVQVVQLLLDRGADPSGPSGRPWLTFPLHAATYAGHTDTAVLLAAHGANVSACDEHGATPLIYAAQKGLFELAELFLDAGADIHQVDGHGQGVLHIALWAQDNPADTLEMFLRRGPPLTAELATDFLHDEIISGRRAAIVEVLLRHGADPNLVDGNNYSRAPLTTAFKEGYYDIVKALVQHGANLDAQDDEGKTALHYASTSLHIPSARLLLDSGADPGLPDRDGNLAVMLTQSPDVVAMMLQKGVAVNHVNNDDNTPLSTAAIYDRAEIGTLLLAAGADVHRAGEQGWTALLAAVGNNSVQTARVLLAAGADPGDARSGHPALFDACDFESPDMAALLLEHGADVSAVCCHGQTALCKAAENGRVEVAACLINHGADIHAPALHPESSPLLAAIRGGHLETVTLLLDHGADVEHAGRDDCTPLLEAIIGGHEDIVSLLLSRGARVDGASRTGSGATVLSIAAAEGHCGMLNRLLEVAEWDLNSTDSYGRTALFRAAMRGHESVVERLLACDPAPELHTKDAWGATALSMAARNGHAGIVQRLLRADEYSAEKLRDEDRAGRGALSGAGRSENSAVWALLAEAAEAVGFGREELERAGGEAPVVPFHADFCYCDVCGRCSTCPIDGLTRQCNVCATDGGGTMLICGFCVAAGLGCLDQGHSWKAYESCSCRDESEGDDSEGDDSEGDDSEGDDGEGDDSEGDDSEGDSQGDDEDDAMGSAGDEQDVDN